MNLKRLAAFFAATILGSTTYAQTASHASNFREIMSLFKRAQDCDDESAICKSIRRRVSMAACAPPFIELSFRANEIRVDGRVTVNPEGRVVSVQIISPSPIRAINEAIADSLTDCRLGVVREDGEPVGSVFDVRWRLLDGQTIIQLP